MSNNERLIVGIKHLPVVLLDADSCRTPKKKRGLLVGPMENSKSQDTPEAEEWRQIRGDESVEK
jgi:hypothetical protein